jgi:hypothetical protein
MKQATTQRYGSCALDGNWRKPYKLLGSPVSANRCASSARERTPSFG